MSRTATGAVLVSCLVALFLGPELGFGPMTSTSRADTRRHSVPQATVVVVVPPFVPVPSAAPAPPSPRPASAATDRVWARLRACESPTNGGAHYRGYYQFSSSAWASAGGTGDPAAASLEEQTTRAQYLAAHSDPARQWPV
ncbi:MAG: transglycosylase family protein, partial [Acidimicrobiia bacterium]|nr:transglycosylase family protein [Acidimicrobiia bacterium]